MEIFLFWIIFSVVAGAIASGKGRSGFGFFMLSIVLSPLVGILCALVAQRHTDKTESEAIETGHYKRCPYCSELVRAEAIKCKHCASDLPTTKTKPDQEVLDVIARIEPRNFR